MSARFDSPNRRQFERLLRDGIIAAKSEQHRLAQSLLRQASMLDCTDARPYIWLSATTDDPAEQLEYLEQAVAIDPSNVAARRGLAMLTGKIDPARLVSEGRGLASETGPATEDVQAQSFLCPSCGGQMSLSVESGELTCSHCGKTRAATPAPLTQAQQSGQVLDFVMPTTTGHRWAQAEQRLTCERCGASSLLPPNQKSNQCAYCGSNQMVISTSENDVLEPELICLMKIDQKQAQKQIKDWLGKDFFAPDNLVSNMERLHLRPAYYSCWVFDGTVEVRWSCEVKQLLGRGQQWMPRSGVETTFFSKVLTPGVRSLSMRELEGLEPYKLDELVAFQPEHLAGWPALVYDRSLSDASILARERVIRRLQKELYHTVEPGYEKRNLTTGSGNFSAVTFQHILLPLWTAAYHYQGKSYRLLVNGQTGKVCGSKPRDHGKVVMIAVGLMLVVAVLLVLYWLLSTMGNS